MDDRLVRWAFETHAPSLHRFATRLTGDPDLAEDLVQEAFIRIADANGIDNEKAWLFRVVSNLAINANRSAGRRRGLLRLLGHRQPVGEPVVDPDEAYEKKEIRLLVHQALQQMPERDRVLLLMRVEGFTQAEIADAIDSTTKSVGTLIARALIRVRVHLEEVQEALT
jgi:RNA polymerase sigma-70 factor (ECF subfamily)